MHSAFPFELIIFIATEAIAVIAAVAAIRASMRDLKERVTTLEAAARNLGKDFVPRSEVELALEAIKETTNQTNGMVHALVYAGSDRDLALRALKASAADSISGIVTMIEASGEPDWGEIVISGIDGKGGLNRWESRTSFMYLDNREINGKPAPLVTVGVGCAISFGEALTLPFQVDGRAAMQSEIARDFAALRLAPFDFSAGYYERFTKCRLPDDAIDELVRRRFASFLVTLRVIFPAFDTWPATAKAATMDLIYGVGPAGLAAPHYPHFRQAGNAGHFGIMAAECGSDTHIRAYDDRNEARANLFLEAAKETAKP